MGRVVFVVLLGVGGGGCVVCFGGFFFFFWVGGGGGGGWGCGVWWWGVFFCVVGVGVLFWGWGGGGGGGAPTGPPSAGSGAGTDQIEKLNIIYHLRAEDRVLASRALPLCAELAARAVLLEHAPQRGLGLVHLEATHLPAGSRLRLQTVTPPNGYAVIAHLHLYSLLHKRRGSDCARGWWTHLLAAGLRAGLDARGGARARVGRLGRFGVG